MKSLHRLERSQLIESPLPTVFAFFADAANLEVITPAFLRFRIDTPLPIAMCQGAHIDYSLSLWGVPLRWRTRISLWEPDARFVDEQERGPYARWRHLHEFQAVDGSTRMRDVVDYQLPLGPLGSVAHALFVRRVLEAIFDYRREAIAERFGDPARKTRSGTPGGAPES